MLYQEVRPTTFADVVGNKTVVAALTAIVKRPPKDRPHVYLFSGPKGCGKTTLARILSQELGCQDVSIIELNAANTRGVDTAREVANGASTLPMFGPCKVYLFDESHQLTGAAQEALLKIAEDCPPHCYFIFCTTEPQKIIATLRSRCTPFTVFPLRKSEMIELLTRVVKLKGFDVPEEAIKIIAEATDGCSREALVLLEQIRDVGDPKEKLAFLQANVLSAKDSIELCREILSPRKNRWEICLDIYNRLDVEPEKLRMTILGYLKACLVKTPNTLEALKFVELIAIFERSTYSSGEAGILRMIFEACIQE